MYAMKESMANAVCAPNPIIIIQKSASTILCRRRAVRVVAMSAENHVSINTSSRSPFQIRLPSRNKVFEDRSKGIVCYREENGEITCEGIDEGPRFHHRSSRFASNQSETDGIIELLERSLLQMVDDDRFT
ncbi:hypothetical protein ACH5RR_024280 [Cinchona calisaya]|uniref:Uncharacterized protein n=1 Tax=Cinchona calisaya TaxID=153742 RepID=A0ABD2Z193_9GENT